MADFILNPCLITDEYVNTFIKKRRRELHKGDCGRVLVVAGSPGMVGAAVLCARAALRGGAGLVRVCIAGELFAVVQGGVAEATCLDRKLLTERLAAGELLEEYQAVVMGPGLGLSQESIQLISLVLRAFRGPLVLDADGLTLLTKSRELERLAKEYGRGGGAGALGHSVGASGSGRASGSGQTSGGAEASTGTRGDKFGTFGTAKGSFPRLILTPHPGEAGRLLGLSGAAVNADRLEAARRLAEEWQAVAVLKGAGTVVAVPCGTTYINTTGNPGMATGGSGDVLAGLIGALAGQGLPTEAAAAAGVYLHGLAGDLAAKRLGEYSLMAMDIAEALPQAFCYILEGAAGAASTGDKGPTRAGAEPTSDILRRGYEEMGALNAALAEEGLGAAKTDLHMYEKWVLESEENDGKER